MTPELRQHPNRVNSTLQIRPDLPVVDRRLPLRRAARVHCRRVRRHSDQGESTPEVRQEKAIISCRH